MDVRVDDTGRMDRLQTSQSVQRGLPDMMRRQTLQLHDRRLKVHPGPPHHNAWPALARHKGVQEIHKVWVLAKLLGDDAFLKIPWEAVPARGQPVIPRQSRRIWANHQPPV